MTDDVINHVYSNHLEPLLRRDARFQYIPPSITQVAALSPGVLDPLQCAGSVVIIPVNRDNLHWSLLVYFARARVCIHYDSLQGYNAAFATHLFHQLKRVGVIADNVRFVPTSDLLQRDGYNCGAFMLCVIELIIRANGHRPLISELQGISTSTCADLRRRWRAALPHAPPSARGPSPSSRRLPSPVDWSLEQALNELLWQGLHVDSGNGGGDATALEELKGKIFQACGTGASGGLQKALTRQFQALGLARMQALFHAFKRCPQLMLFIYDRFVTRYETLYRTYRSTKQEARWLSNLHKPSPSRSNGPSLSHDVNETFQRKTVPGRKDYYRHDRSPWARHQLAPQSSPAEDLEQGNDDLRAWLHTLVNLSLWRKVFSTTYPKGLRGQSVAHFLELETPFGQVLVHNMKYISGKGTTRFLLKLTNLQGQSPPLARGTPRTDIQEFNAETVFLDASYGDELKLLTQLMKTCRLTDAQVATQMLSMLGGRLSQPMPQFFSVEVTTSAVTVVMDSAQWQSRRYGDRPLFTGQGLAQEVRKNCTVTCRADLILVYLCSHFFLAEPRHALPLFLGNMEALALVERGVLTFKDLLERFPEREGGEEGSLFPSYNYGERWREIRLPLLQIAGYYDHAPDLLDYKSQSPRQVNTRQLLALGRTEDDGALFALHKILFMHFLCWMFGTDIDPLLKPLWEG
ncbi:Ulp1 family isopeptidase [Corallococcus llansteffanensis]|uniref:Ulp1 family isopeptidase n=1 Tax=Corallococcus llansteffanensis TaxID=2316731 RepID=UPI0013151D3E|nr:Ulp1 family isopeptidase [Corallococcus llansteffanensis]